MHVNSVYAGPWATTSRRLEGLSLSTDQETSALLYLWVERQAGPNKSDLDTNQA